MFGTHASREIGLIWFMYIKRGWIFKAGLNEPLWEPKIALVISGRGRGSAVEDEWSKKFGTRAGRGLVDVKLSRTRIEQGRDILDRPTQPWLTGCIWQLNKHNVSLVWKVLWTFSLIFESGSKWMVLKVEGRAKVDGLSKSGRSLDKLNGPRR